MPRIGTGAFDNLLGGLLDIGQQAGGLASELAQELSPVLVLESDRDEWCFLKGERCSQGLINVAANAGFGGLARFRNPSTSGMLMVIGSIQVAVNPPATAFIISIFLGSAATDLPTVVTTKNARDSRQVTEKPAAILSSDNAGAAVVGTQVEANASVNSALQFVTPPIIVAPGGSVDVSASTANLNIFVNFHWFERKRRQYE